MDQELVQFREAAARENRGRRHVRRRYSRALQEQAVRIGRRATRRARAWRRWPPRWASRRGACGGGCSRRRPARGSSRCTWRSRPRRRRRRGSLWCSRQPARGWKAWMWTRRRACWGCCGEMGRPSRGGVCVHGAGGHAKGFDGLCALVSQGLQRDPLNGDVFVFVSRNRVRAKVLHFDGTGLCVYAKRLERGRFAALWGTRATRRYADGQRARSVPRRQHAGRARGAHAARAAALFACVGSRAMIKAREMVKLTDERDLETLRQSASS